MSEILTAARALSAAGLSVLPIRLPEKHPILLPTGGDGRPTWQPFQEQIADDAQLVAWFSRRARAIALVCGAVSGNLEAIDFDHHPPAHPQRYAAWAELVEAQAPGLVARLVVATTLRGGRHVFYRCAEIGGNDKLARYWDTDPTTGKPKRMTAIETRGEGGYVVIAPSGGYTVEQGRLTEIPVITPEEREILRQSTRVFGEVDAAPFEPQTSNGESPAALLPGQDYNQRTGMAEVGALLERHGWAKTLVRGAVSYWRRPGKPGRTWSATLNFIPNALYVFSGNADPFDSERSYLPFGVYGLLEHGGDFSAAARALRRLGYGGPLPAQCNGQPGEADTPGTGAAASPQADLAAILAQIRGAADRPAVLELLPELVAPGAALSRPDLFRVTTALERRGVSVRKMTEWSRMVNQARQGQAAEQATAVPEDDQLDLAPPADPAGLSDFAPWVCRVLNQRAGTRRPARELVGATLRDFLLARGQLIYEADHAESPHRRLYLLTDDYRTVPLTGLNNLALGAALALTGLNASEPAYGWTAAQLASAAFNQGRHVKMRRFAFTDFAGRTIYISCGSTGYVVARPGQPLEYRHNADDGIIFNAMTTFPPWDWTAPPTDFRQLVGFRPPLQAPPEAPEYTPTLQWELLAIYYLGVIMWQRPLPMLAFIGGKGGGKSTTARALLKGLLGREAQIGTLSSDPRDLSTRAAREVIVTFDNLDNPPEDWALDAIAACVTGSAKIERVLYTNNELLQELMDAALLTTTRTAPFSRLDIIERILPLFAGDPGDAGRISEDDIYDQIAVHRDGAFVYMAQLAANMLPYREQAPVGLPGRFVDFNRLAYSYFAATGRPELTAPALAAWRRAYTLAVGEPDPLLRAIMAYLPAAGLTRMTSLAIIRELADHAQQGGDSLPHLGGGKAVARQLRELRSALIQMGVDLAEDRDISSNQALFTLAWRRKEATTGC